MCNTQKMNNDWNNVRQTNQFTGLRLSTLRYATIQQFTINYTTIPYYYTLVYAHFMVNYTTIRYYTQVYAYFTLILY